jgi:hypothetical protein
MDGEELEKKNQDQRTKKKNKHDCMDAWLHDLTEDHNKGSKSEEPGWFTNSRVSPGDYLGSKIHADYLTSQFNLTGQAGGLV